MILSYGNYAHPDNEANASISRVGIEAEDGFVYAFNEIWNITGILHGDTDAALFKAMNDLLDAYSLQGRDLIWKKGNTVMHQLLSQNTLTGTKVSTLPHFPKNTGGRKVAFLPTLTGKYQKQQLTESSTITIVQSGMKVGLGGYPAPISRYGLTMSIRIEGRSIEHPHVDVTVSIWNTPFIGITHLNGTTCSQLRSR